MRGVTVEALGPDLQGRVAEDRDELTARDLFACLLENSCLRNCLLPVRNFDLLTRRRIR
jgi:hypothetical protein